jgi:hypothetical protein
MDIDVLCVACNWSNDFWEWIAAGVGGVAAWGTAAWRSTFGWDHAQGGFPSHYRDAWQDYEDALGDRFGADNDGGDVTPPDQRHYDVGGRARYKDESGNPYWPGVSPYPSGGTVYHHGSPLPVDAAGVPVGGMADVIAAQTAGSRA